MKTSFLFLLLAGSFGFLTSHAQTFEWKEASSNGFSYKYVTNDPTETRYYVLDNGLTVILTVNQSEPRCQTIIATKAGSKTDPKNNTGLAHYLEHMLFKGTDQYGSLDWDKEKPLLDEIDQLYSNYNATTDPALRKSIYRQIDSVSGLAAKYAIANEYDKMMSSIGAKGTNAFTWYEETAYINDIPTNQLDKWLKIEAERFRNPILRLFHTELEAVYEEKNISLDSDDERVSDSLFAGLFKKHNYGLQTTIGTVEHLKNPSLTEIRKYYETYYVPNNMCIIIAGDIDPDKLIQVINSGFSYMKRAEVPVYTFEPEDPITQPVLKTVTGPEPASFTMAFRFPGANSKEGEYIELLSEVLSNGEAGLLDLNLVKKQQLLDAYAYTYKFKDYSVLTLGGEPKNGQSLEQVKNLILAELENLKKGNFDDDLIISIQNNYRKYLIQQQERNTGRAFQLLDAFITEVDWKDEISKYERLSKITRKDVMDFASQWLGNNYIAVDKKQGKLPEIAKVEKPAITPVEVNRESESPFLRNVLDEPVKDIQPVFLQFDKDIQKGKIGNVPVLSIPNTTNELFTLYYLVDLGTYHDKRLGVATNLLQYLGTDQYTSEEISKAFYKLACSFNVFSTPEQTYIALSGLEENFDAAVALMEHVLSSLKPDDKALKETIAMILKERADAKAAPYSIFGALANYATYGPVNPTNDILDKKSLQKLTSEELATMLRALTSYPHTVLYYGPRNINELTGTLSTLHKVPGTFTTVPPLKIYTPADPSSTNVYFTDYNKVQTEIGWVRPVADFNPDLVPMATMFNEYFGGGMSSIVFQEIRESKALAYSSYSVMTIPGKKEFPLSMIAYIGCQSDKMKEAILAMNELLNNLPLAEKNIQASALALQNNYRSSRIQKASILFNYLTAERRGISYDIREKVYQLSEKVALDDVSNFHKQYVAGKPFNLYVLGSKNKVDFKFLESQGKVQKLTLKQIFGY